MFLRIKRIKGNEYAYVSENRWMKRKQKVRQETKKYLGRVYRFSKVKDECFVCNSIEEMTAGDLIKSVVRHELANHGFITVGTKICNNECFVDLKNSKVYGKRGLVAIGMNNGFLSDYTLGRLFCYNKIKDSYSLAKIFVEAGLEVPKEAFVEIYKKIFKGFEEDEII